MTKDKAALGPKILQLWQGLSAWPGGKWLFSRMLGWLAPYTGTIGAGIQELRPGYACVALRERRKVRNHLNSVHAIALMNLGEVATGLALMTGLKPGVRGIITGLSMEYFKKARGRLVAVCETTQPHVTSDMEHRVVADIKDEAGELVAQCQATWRLGPTP